jgi:serine-type D-Ala-D-Ala carboxypeptidase/endopeptidase (penicillin-binding protein 4)
MQRNGQCNRQRNGKATQHGAGAFANRFRPWLVGYSLFGAWLFGAWLFGTNTLPAIAQSPEGQSAIAVAASPTPLSFDPDEVSAQSQRPQTQSLQPQTLAQAVGGVCPAQLSGRLSASAQKWPLSSAGWGMVVQTLGQTSGQSKPQTLYSKSPTALLVPASNTKVLTTAAALARLGPNYRIRTAVYGNPANASSGALATLRIVGQGDPGLTTPQLNRLATTLQAKGIRQVGQLIGDDTYFKGPAINPYWDPDDTVEAYGAAVTSLILNQNIIGLTMVPQGLGQPLLAKWDDPTDQDDWRLNNDTATVSRSSGESIDTSRSGNVVTVSGQLRVGSAPELVGVAVPNAGNYLVGKFRKVLGRNGITVNSSTLVRSSPRTPGEVELASVESEPLSQMIFVTNQESNNLYAEALMKTLGQMQNPATTNATVSGTAAIRTILAGLGVDSAGIALVDGSGLADRNRISALALAQTLQAVAAYPNFETYRRSLPVSGRSGTLKDRFKNSAAQGIVFAKTGTITGAVSLSGYVYPPNHPPVVFSVIVNSGASASSVRSQVDSLVLTLAQLRRC